MTAGQVWGVAFVVLLLVIVGLVSALGECRRVQEGVERRVRALEREGSG